MGAIRAAIVLLAALGPPPVPVRGGAPPAGPRPVVWLELPCPARARAEWLDLLEAVGVGPSLRWEAARGSAFDPVDPVRWELLGASGGWTVRRVAFGAPTLPGASPVPVRPPRGGRAPTLRAGFDARALAALGALAGPALSRLGKRGKELRAAWSSLLPAEGALRLEVVVSSEGIGLGLVLRGADSSAPPPVAPASGAEAPTPPFEPPPGSIVLAGPASLVGAPALGDGAAAGGSLPAEGEGGAVGAWVWPPGGVAVPPRPATGSAGGEAATLWFAARPLRGEQVATVRIGVGDREVRAVGFVPAEVLREWWLRRGP